MVQGTQRFRHVQDVSLRNTLRHVWFVLSLVLMIVWRGSLPALIYPGGQGYMESPSRVQLESYYNTIRYFLRPSIVWNTFFLLFSL